MRSLEIDWDLIYANLDDFKTNVAKLLLRPCIACMRYMDYEVDQEQESTSTNKSAGETVRAGHVIGKTKEGTLIRVM